MMDIFMRRGCGCIFAGEYRVWSCEDRKYGFTHQPVYFTDDAKLGAHADQNEWSLMTSEEHKETAIALEKLIGDGYKLSKIRGYLSP
ncbi:MAG: hypothetical protein ACWGQW_03145 [bacterium]